MFSQTNFGGMIKCGLAQKMKIRDKNQITFWMDPKVSSISLTHLIHYIVNGYLCIYLCY